MNKKTLLMFIGAGTLFLAACKQGDSSAATANAADSTSAAASKPTADDKAAASSASTDPLTSSVKKAVNGHLVESVTREGTVGVINYGAGDGKAWSQNNMAAKTLAHSAGEVLAANADLNAVRITIQDTGKKYVLNITRDELEKFLGTKLSEASKDWTLNFIMKLPANQEARDKFVAQFVKTE